MLQAEVRGTAPSIRILSSFMMSVQGSSVEHRMILR